MVTRSICITEKKEDDEGQPGKTSLTVVRTFVKAGNRINGRAEILTGLKPGDRVVAVGQLKLQSGAAVAISTDPTPPIPAKPPPDCALLKLPALDGPHADEKRAAALPVGSPRPVAELTGINRDGHNRYLHQTPSAFGRGQPADPL